jgi:hypothetical protein
MKIPLNKTTLGLIAFFLTVFVSCGLGFDPDNPRLNPPELDLIRMQPKPLEYVLSQEEALEDLQAFHYILKNAWAGYLFHLDQGLDFPARVERAMETLEVIEEISLWDFEILLGQVLDGVVDNHFGIYGQGSLRFKRQQKWSYSEIVIQESGGERIVVESPLASVAAGSLYTGSMDQAFPLYSSAESLYRLGHLGEPLEEIELSFDNRPITIPLRQSERAPELDFPLVRKSNTSRTAYIRVASLDNKLEDLMDAFVQLGLDAREKDFVVLDYRGNRGGNDRYTDNFLRNLYDIPLSVALPSSTMQHLRSPLVIRQIQHQWGWGENIINSYKRNYLEYSEGTEPWVETYPVSRTDWPQPGPEGFQGKLVLLVDGRSASSGEGLIPLVATIPGSVILGEATSGTKTFGNMMDYYLGHSGIQIYAGFSFFQEAHLGYPFVGDGIGFRPDSWCSTKEELVQNLREITGEDPGQWSREFRLQ